MEATVQIQNSHLLHIMNRLDALENGTRSTEESPVIPRPSEISSSSTSPQQFRSTPGSGMFIHYRCIDIRLSSSVGPLNNHANCHSSEINLKGYRFTPDPTETGLEEKPPISPETAKSWLQSMFIWISSSAFTFINFPSALRQPKQPRSFITHSKGLYAHDTLHRR